MLYLSQTDRQSDFLRSYVVVAKINNHRYGAAAKGMVNQIEDIYILQKVVRKKRE